MYPNALQLQNGSRIINGRRLQLIDKPNDKPNYRVNVNLSTFSSETHVPNSSEGIWYTDPISRVFYRNFTLINCNPMYPNDLELQNGSWITYGRRIQLIDKPNDMPNYRVNVNLSASAPVEGFFNDRDLEISKRAQRLRHSRKTITGRKVFLGQEDLYETLEYSNMNC